MSRSKFTKPTHRLVNVASMKLKGNKGFDGDRLGFEVSLGGNKHAARVVAAHKRAIRQERRRFLKKELENLVNG